MQHNINILRYYVSQKLCLKGYSSEQLFDIIWIGRNFFVSTISWISENLFDKTDQQV